jgi:hypothetical protein
LIFYRVSQDDAFSGAEEAAEKVSISALVLAKASSGAKALLI